MLHVSLFLSICITHWLLEKVYSSKFLPVQCVSSNRELQKQNQKKNHKFFCPEIVLFFVTCFFNVHYSYYKLLKDEKQKARITAGYSLKPELLSDREC